MPIGGVSARSGVVRGGIPSRPKLLQQDVTGLRHGTSTGIKSKPHPGPFLPPKQPQLCFFLVAHEPQDSPPEHELHELEDGVPLEHELQDDACPVHELQDD